MFEKERRIFNDVLNFNEQEIKSSNVSDNTPTLRDKLKQKGAGDFFGICILHQVRIEKETCKEASS